MARVLYVHTEAVVANRVATELARIRPGLSVVAATTVTDAVDTLRTSALECVVSALDPATETGRDLLRALREADPEVPQVLAWDLDADATAALAARVEPVLPTDVDALLDAIPGVVCLVDADGTIRQWNATADATMSTADATIAGRAFVDFLVAGARDRVGAAFEAALDGERRTVEGPLRTGSGDRRPYEWSVARIGEERLCVVGRDRSDLTAAEAELADVEASLAALYQTLSDRDSTFESRLDRILKLGCDQLGVDYGFLTRIADGTQEVVAARGDHPLLQPGERCPLSEAYCRKAIRSDGLLGVVDAAEEGWATDPAYETFGLGCYLGGEVVLADGPYGTLCFADDDPRETSFTGVDRTFVELLTRWVSYELDQRAVHEELERQNERLSEFASIVSHDLRNPLNVAAGQLEIARETGDERHLAEVEDALDRMEELVTGLLDLAREGTVIDSVDAIELADVAAEAWTSVSTDDGELVVETNGAVAADRSRLRQLFENLFRNAIEHGADGDGSASPITVRVGDVADGFFVSDTGRGVPAGQRTAVFERGHSEDGGTGLGLALVRSIADAHGWTTALEEGESGGARFVFTGVERPGP